MKRILRLAVLIAFCMLAFAARCHNVRDVFIDGRIYFVDADCYSRMTRARIVSDHPGTIVRHQDFENYPRGVNSHATAPLDYLIVSGKKILDAGFAIFGSEKTGNLRDETLDLSGALSGPLIGVAGVVFLAIWAWSLRLRFWGMPLLIYAVSPILVHGTVLGRPDHQSLLVLTLMIALGAEIALARKGGEPEERCRAARSEPESKDLSHSADNGEKEVVRVRPQSWASRVTARWGIVAGAAWALSLWVSLYEPLILLGAVLALWLVFDRRALLALERRPGWIVCATILAGAFLLEGWRIAAPDSVRFADFAKWERTIGELAHLDLRTALLAHWLGWTVLAAPVLLVIARKTERRALPLLVLLLLMVGLTVWQIRWGYFLGVVFVLALPFQMAVLQKAWIAWPVFIIALWPVAQDWDATLFPSEPAETARAVKRAEAENLRALAELMRGEKRAPFLAPWWISPALAYWSGQPGVAGSSHESLPGTMETARFFLAPGPDKAEAIVQRLGVRFVVTDGPDADGVSRLVKAYAPLLDGKVPPEPWGVWMHEHGRPRERMSAEEVRDVLPEMRAELNANAARAEAAELGSSVFSCIAQNPFFKLFVVRESPRAP